MAHRKINIKQLPTQLDLPSNRNKHCFFQNLAESSSNGQILQQDRSNHQNKQNNVRQSLIETHPLKMMNLSNIDSLLQSGEQEVQKQFAQNEAKLCRLRNKLGQLFQHYQSEKKHLGMIRCQIQQNERLEKENQTLYSQIQKIRCMLKETLLVREKMKLWE